MTLTISESSSGGLYACHTYMYLHTLLQWNLSIQDTLNKGDFCNEDTVYSPNHIELCKTASELRKFSIQDSQLVPNGDLYRESERY